MLYQTNKSSFFSIKFSARSPNLTTSYIVTSINISRKQTGLSQTIKYSFIYRYCCCRNRHNKGHG